jgi:DNA ligase-1
MRDLADGETVEMQGSGAKPYILKNVGGVYSCTCPAWRNQSTPIESRTCKHLRKLRGDAAETARTGAAAAARPVATEEGEEAEAAGPPLLLAQAWDNTTDLADWWMSEKLDGVRAYWDGAQFLSRLGNRYHAPPWFVEGLPETPLDGELWIDRKKFQRTVSIARRQDQSDLWREIRFLVFDAPACAGSFEERLEFVSDCLRRQQPPHAQAHAHERCRGVDHLRQELARVEALGGEGLMLRQPGSRYIAGRSFTLVKVKSFHDAEATVTGHVPGKGKHRGKLGALAVTLPDGTQFSIGTGFSEKDRTQPPAVGSVVTFRYQELSDGGVPRFPSYIGVRPDFVPTAAPAKKDQPQRAAKPGPVSVASVGTKPRYFEFVGGTSQKFWEISVDGCEATVRYGRIGSAGQSKTKSFPDPAAAARHAENLIAEKTRDGYLEQ